MRKGRVAGPAIFALAFTLLWGCAIFHARSLAAEHGGLSVRLTGGGMQKRVLSKLTEAAPESGLNLAAAWTRGAETAALSESSGGAADLRVITVSGDPRKTAPMTLLSGSVLTEDDDLGCLIDSASAQALFHAVDVLGAKLTVAGKAYRVRGVVKTYEACVFVRTENGVYENLAFECDDPSLGRAAAEALLNRYAANADYVIVESGLYARILMGLSFLPGAAALLAVGTGLLLRAKATRGGARAALCLAALGCVAAAAGIVLKTFYWPQNFLPTRLSDFAFWERLVAEWRAEWKAMTLLTPLPGEITFFSGMRAAIAELAAALLLEAGLITACAAPRETPWERTR